MRSRRSYEAFLPITIRKPRRSVRNTNRPIREGIPRGSTTVLTDEANVASASPAPARNERTRSAITPDRTLAPEEHRHRGRDERAAPGAASCSPGAGRPNRSSSRAQPSSTGAPTSEPYSVHDPS